MDNTMTLSIRSGFSLLNNHPEAHTPPRFPLLRVRALELHGASDYRRSYYISLL